MQKKKPCSECRRWYLPNPRVGDRQRTCGSPECRKARHGRKDHEWHAAHRDYDRGRRWQAKLDAAKAAEGVTWPSGPRPLGEVPWDLAQDEMGTKAAVIVGEIVRLVVGHAQDEIARQLAEITEQIGEHAPGEAARRDSHGERIGRACGHGP